MATSRMTSPGSDFKGAGQVAGLEIWRIEKMRPVPVPKEVYGKFYSGDSYIVLHTIVRGSRYSWDIHFWLGKETTQDEAGVAAYKTVELDDALGGGPVQYREVQGHESQRFLSLFRGGVEYLKGGVESGFKHVDREAFETRLLHLKGKRNVRCSPVPVSYESLNSGDVFILDTGRLIYQWNGKSSSRMEKAKGLEVSTRIRGSERGGKARIAVLEEGKKTKDMAGFWKALGGEGPVKSASEGGDDVSHEKAASAATKLFRVSDASGTLQVTEEVGDTLSRKMLDTNDCFILDCESELFVWIGKKSTYREKKDSMKNASEFLKKYNRPTWTPITRIIENGETPLFKEKFPDWAALDFQMPVTPSQSRVAHVQQEDGVNVEDMYRGGSGAVESMPDDASGTLKIWRIEDFAKVEWDEALYGQFYQGDSFIILYTYEVHGREQYIIYYWQGRDSSADEKGASALLTTQLDDELEGQAVQVRVVQGKEPKHFLKLFFGKMIVHEGGRASGFKNVADKDSYDIDGVSLFHVRGTGDVDTRAVQVEEKAASLNSGDAFVLLTPKTMFVWLGKGCSQDEQKVSLNIAKLLKGPRTLKKVSEGHEPEEFWSFLGGKAEYASSSKLGVVGRDPRLFHCSNASGKFVVEEIFSFCQDDLDPDDVYLLDTFDEVFVWVGKGALEEENKKAMETALDYVQKSPDGRSPDTPILRVSQGYEPPMFTAHFLAWDRSKAESGEDPFTVKLRELEAAGKLELSESGGASVQDAMKAYEVTYTLAELQKRPLPSEVDPTKVEQYLSDDEFKQVMGCTKDEFKVLPRWKQVNVKKKANLF